MKLEYEVIEDSFDDTTQIRTMTEQALLKGKGWLVRTTLYTPHNISASVMFLPDKRAKGKLFKPVGA
jgi:hypothetical protein